MKTIKKFKGLLKAVVFAMLMVFVLQGCDDEQNVSNESNNHEIMIKHLSESDLLKNDFIKEITDKIKDISTKKNITSSDSTFVIKTKSFYKTTLDSVTNYSFLLLRNDKEYGELYYENFIVTEINNVYSFSIAKFNMENSELLSLETVDSNLVSLQQIIDTTTKMELMDNCIIVSYLPCDGNGNADGHDAVEGYCHGSATVLDFSGCSSGGYGGSSGSSGNSNGNPNQGTGNTDNTNDSSTSSNVWQPSLSSFGATTVVILDLGQMAVDNFFDNLTVNEQNAIPLIIKKKISTYLYSNFSGMDQAGANNTTIFYNIITWLANNNNQSNVLSNCIAILDFLNENGNNTPEAQAFAQEAMEAMMAGGEFYDGIIIDSTIVSNTRVHNIYNKLKNLSNSIFSDIINNNFQSSKIARIRFRIGNTPDGEDAYTKGSTNNGISSSYDVIINSNLIDSLSNIEVALIFIHESIHAELLDRCVRMGIINAFDSSGYPNFTDSSITFSTQEALFAGIVNFYKNYPVPNNSQWNHDLFTILDYRNILSQNLISIHPFINDINNDFLTNINNDPLNSYGNFTLQQVMNYISWIGLEGTQNYINTIQNNSLEHQKKVYIEDAARLFYSHN